MLLALALFLALAPPQVRAEVRLPNIFGSHMVLQQQKPIPVWGWANPGEQITVRLADVSKQATADNTGKWKLSLPPVKAGGPCEMTVSGTNTVTFKDVVFGEVWVCSGQSNMEMGVSMCQNGQQEIATANYPSIRLMMVPRNIAATPQDNISATWSVCSPQTVGQGGWGGFSAAAFFFGRELEKTLNVPIGLVDASWGGTRIEPWTPEHAFAEIPSLKGIHDQVTLTDPKNAIHKQRLGGFLAEMDQWTAQARLSMEQGKAVAPVPAFPKELDFPNEPTTPTALYNGMIHPLVPFGIRGAIWYQGESNHLESATYLDKMTALIGGWRGVWGQGDFPFYYVQIAPYEYGDEPSHILPAFWEAQTAAMRAIPNTGMVVTTDIGELKDIHPRNKQEVGRRLALWALARTYGRHDVVCCGPTFKSLKTEGGKLRLCFDNSGGGLVARDGKPLSGFEIIDRDNGGFVPASAIIDGEQLLLSAEGVANPVAVRFSWNKLANPNLTNRQGLPAIPFRAGDVPKRNALSLIGEATNYQLVYDLDLANLGEPVKYSLDHHLDIKGEIDRIAYLIELGGNEGQFHYAWVSMAPFTKDLTKIGVPTAASGAFFQQNIAHLNVESNVPGVVTGKGLAGGNIEFWPNSYNQSNSANVPNASSQTYDFGDQPVDGPNGYGSMQVHNHDAKQTIFAVNHWSAGAAADIGIGNRPEASPDWTFAGNAGSYAAKRLRVLVHVR